MNSVNVPYEHLENYQEPKSCEASCEAGWEAIEAQINHWAEMDAEYWRQRKEREYKAWLKRTYGI